MITKLIMGFLVIVGLVFAAYIIISTDKGTDLDPIDASFNIEDGDGDEFRVQYVTGDLLEMERISIRFTIDGEHFRVHGPDAGLGDTWTAGESVCGVGPDCIRDTASTASVQVSYDGRIIFRSQEQTLR